MVTLWYHVDNHALSHITDSTDSSWLNMTWHLFLYAAISYSSSTNRSKFGTMCLVFFSFFSACAFPWITKRHVCRKGCCPAAWNSSLLVLCSVNQVSWAVTTSLHIRARESLYLLICPTVLCNLITQMKQAQTISSYKIRNCIWQFLNKCIQVQLKAFQFCQVLVE